MVSKIETDPFILLPSSQNKARLRLFCFPYAGSGAGVYHRWPDNLSPEIEVCRIQYPGRENRLREKPFTSLSELVKAMTPVLRPYLDKPFAFYGHSMGSIAAFEVAREIRAEYGLNPSYFFASGFRAPQVRLTTQIHQLPDNEFVDQLRNIYGGISDEILQYPEIVELMLPTIRADMTMVETYLYKEDQPFDCPFSAFGGLGDIWVSKEQLAGWKDQTNSSFDLKMFDGDHFFVKSAQEAILKEVSAELEQTISRVA